MRVSQKEKDKSHARILAAAARLLRERGIETTSVADVMGAAGMSHGGFYRHFADKDGLVDAALASAFEEFSSELETRLEKGDQPEKAVGDYRTQYLSKDHANNPGLGCPVAALGGEVARGLSALKTAFGAGVNRMLGLLSRGQPGTARERRDRAARDFAMMVGAIVIARASDPQTARTVLAACRKRPNLDSA
jgi:TetR/AcrR family transcriptional repressor of nem operon